MLETKIKENFTHFARTVYESKYAMKDEQGNVLEDWNDTAYRVTLNVLDALGYTEQDEEFQKVLALISERKFMPGGRYLYSAGRELKCVNNCFLMRAEDSREGWAELLYKITMVLSLGGGVGIDYSDIRPSGTFIKKTGGIASGPLALMKMVNEVGRGIMSGGNRRAALWAGLNWDHGDIEEFITMKNWPDDVKALKEKDFTFPADMDYTNISVLLDDEFFDAYHNEDHPKHTKALTVYQKAVNGMISAGEPGFSIDIGDNAGETLRNPCTEITSHDDSDVCNLGSINLSRIETPEEMDEAVKYATLFLLAGTVYADLPYEKVKDVRVKNRRLGLGLMGIHEWLLQRDYRYEPNEELGEWLEIYQNSTEYAREFAEQHGISTPIATRAIAPNGTISLVAETTSGIEPIFCVAYKRRIKTAHHSGKDQITYQYVVDPTARRLVQQGVDWKDIEDAYMLSYNIERRIAFQAWIGQYVDQAISSTCNLPWPITDSQEAKDFGNLLMKYLPELRGITMYPDGCRSGQPLSAVPYNVASQHEGVVFEEDAENSCRSGVCGA